MSDLPIVHLWCNCLHNTQYNPSPATIPKIEFSSQIVLNQANQLRLTVSQVLMVIKQSCFPSWETSRITKLFPNSCERQVLHVCVCVCVERPDLPLSFFMERARGLLWHKIAPNRKLQQRQQRQRLSHYSHHVAALASWPRQRQRLISNLSAAAHVSSAKWEGSSSSRRRRRRSRSSLCICRGCNFVCGVERGGGLMNSFTLGC